MLRRSLFSSGAILAALAALRPAAAADAAPKLTADDYIEIQQLYANYAHALDKGESERSLRPSFSMVSSPGGEGRAEAAKFEVRPKAKTRS